MTENEFKNRIIESALTPNARLVAFVLLQYRNRVSGDCYPSQVTLSESCGLTKNTIIRAIRELEDCGYISINQKRLKGHKFTCNFYVFEFQSSTIEPSNDLSNDRSNDPSNDGAIIAPKPINAMVSIEAQDQIKKAIVSQADVLARASVEVTETDGVTTPSLIFLSFNKHKARLPTLSTYFSYTGL